MIKVFLAEDEYVIRESIRKTIPWEAEGLQLVGEAGDGEMAYPKILHEQPDILITDIRMPFMDGLELAQLVKKSLPGIHILVLSGYDDFEYAKRAISIGVEEYLLKPITEETLVNELRKISRNIENDRREQEARERYLEEREEVRMLEQRHFFHELLNGRMSTLDAVDKGEKLGIHMTASVYRTSLLQLRLAGESEQMPDTYSDRKERIMDRVRRYVNEHDCLYMYEQIGGVLCILEMADGREELEAHEEELEEALKRLQTGDPDLLVFVAIGHPVERIRELKESYQAASKHFAERFLFEESHIFRCQDPVQEEHSASGRTLDIRNLDIGKIEQKYIRDFLRNGAEDEVEDFVKDYLESLGSGGTSSLLLREYVVMGTVFCVLSFLESLGMSHEDTNRELGDFQDVPAKGQTLESAGAYLTELLEQTIRIRNRLAEKKYSDVIDRARAYISENYAREDISLHDVAARVNVSPSHFSAVFSQEMGETFIEYLTRVRMEKARELLACSPMRTSDVGFEVGYKDPHYFSYVFKKVQGMTPKEYRKSRSR